MRFLTKGVAGRVLTASVPLLCLTLYSCDGLDITGLPGAGEPIQLSREITLGELEQVLNDGAARVEVEMLSEGFVARRVVLRNAEWLAEQEELEGRIIDMQVVEGQGTLTLMLGGLAVTFDAETRFGAGDDELGFDGFIDRVEALLAEGLEPPVEAGRSPRDLPQAPGDATFLAGKLKLRDGLEAPELSLNIDLDNLELNADRQAGEPDGWLSLLGLRIELRVSDGITELATEETDVSDAVEFEGIVQSVNADQGYFTFTDGTQVFITESTQIFEADVDFPLTSLEQVKAALEEGLEVIAWGGGELIGMEPKVINALELRFAARHGDDGGPDIVEFEGFVIAVNLDTGTFTLTNGTIVRITDRTELILTGEGETLESLSAVRDALEAGFEVIAYGAGEVESHEPLTLVALEMRFLLKQGESNIESFEGIVEHVDLESLGFFTLSNGIVVKMAEGTQIKQPEQGEALFSLEDVRNALEAGHTVVAWGKGEVESTEPLTLCALEVYFVISS